MAAHLERHAPTIRFRPARLTDLDTLLELENRTFAYDQMSRRSFRRLIGAHSASLIVVERDGRFAGYALLFFRPNSRIARLYSIAVAQTGHGLGPVLLAAAEEAARRRSCTLVRLEVHEANAGAIRRYRKSGYIFRGHRRGYYTDGADAQRFEKPLA